MVESLITFTTSKGHSLILASGNEALFASRVPPLLQGLSAASVAVCAFWKNSRRWRVKRRGVSTGLRMRDHPFGRIPSPIPIPAPMAAPNVWLRGHGSRKSGSQLTRRYVRLWWEAGTSQGDPCWRPWAKGGSFSKYYYDIHTVIHWSQSRASYFGFMGTANRPLERPASVQYFFRPGLTWPRRTNGLSIRVMPKGSIFADKGPGAFVMNDDPETLLALLAMANSQAFGLLVSVQLARTPPCQ